MNRVGIILEENELVCRKRLQIKKGGMNHEKNVMGIWIVYYVASNGKQ